MKKIISIFLILLSISGHTQIISGNATSLWGIKVPNPAGQSGALTLSGGLLNWTPGGGGGGAVSSVFGRTGTITAQSADYSTFYLQNITGYIAANSPLTIGGSGTLISPYSIGIKDSIFETYQPYSFEVYNRSYWTNLNDFTVTGTAPTISSTGGIIFTGGASNNSNFIAINNTTSLDENFSMEVSYVATSVAGYGIIAGKYSTQLNNPFGYAAGYDLVNNQTHVYMPNFNITRTTNNSNFVVAANDVCRLTFTQKGVYQIAKFEDLTQGYSSTTTYQASQATGEMCVLNYAGTVEVKQIKVTSTTNKKPYILTVGDSKTEAPTQFQTYYTYLKKLGIVESWASQAVQTADALSTINYLTKYIKPTYVILNVGRNDLATHSTYYGSDSTIWQGNYNSIVNKLDSAGIKVIHLLPIPEPISNFPNTNAQTILANFIKRTYPAQYVDPSIGWTDALYLGADSTHPNEAGSRFIAKAIIASGLIPSSGNNFQNDVINPPLNVPTSIVGNYNTTTNQTNTFLLPQTFNSTITVGNAIPSIAGSFGNPSGILKFFNTSLNRVALQTDVTGTNNQLAAYNSSGQLTPVTLGTNLSITSGVLNATGGGTITLTTTSNFGSSTLTGTTLNVPTYTLAGLGGISSSTAASTYFPLIGGSITGTGGAGFVGFINQTSAPSTPSSGTYYQYSNSGNPAYMLSSGFNITHAATLTASRVVTWPDASLTVAGLGTNNAFTGNNTSSGTLNITNSTATTSATTGALTVTGGVGVSNGIYVNGSTTNSTLKIGTMELQNFGISNSWVADNAYFDGTVFRFRASSAAGLFYFQGAEGQFRFAASQAAGTAWPATNNCQLKVNADGSIAIGAAVSDASGTYTGSKFLFNNAGRALFGTITDNAAGILQTAGNIVPATDNTYTNGSTSFKWSNVNSVLGTFTGNVNAVNFISTSATPTIVAGAGAGTSPTISITGNNQDFTVVLTVGTIPTASAVVATITLASLSYSTTTRPIFSPRLGAATLISGTSMVSFDPGTGGAATNTIVINSGAVALPAGTYTWGCHVGGN